MPGEAPASTGDGAGAAERRDIPSRLHLGPGIVFPEHSKISIPPLCRFVKGEWIRKAGIEGGAAESARAVGDAETEAGQLDGTLAHAIERIFGLTVAAGGFTNASAAGVLGIADAAAGPYPYAQRIG